MGSDGSTPRYTSKQETRIHSSIRGPAGGRLLFAVLILILFLLILVIRLIAVDQSHTRADAIASKAAQAVPAGLHTDPIIDDDPDHNQAKALIFHRLDDALRGQPNVLSIRRFTFEGNFPIEVINPRQEKLPRHDEP